MANNKLARPYITTIAGQRIPLGFAARRTLFKYHTGGTWHYIPHTVGGVTRLSHYLTGETWHGEKAIIFRVRRWYKKWDPESHEIVQDQYPYFVPSSINNTQGAPARNALATAVSNWQSVLTEAQKIEYNKRATKGLRMSGYNLYIREYVRENA